VAENKLGNELVLRKLEGVQDFQQNLWVMNYSK
jgi:hypothetical protein